MTAKKKKFTAVAPDGTVFTRNSTHGYTHAVLVFDERPGRTKGWGVLSFNSRLDLAQKEAARWIDLYPKFEIVQVTS